MNFVKNQEVTMPENVGCITELTANSCYKGLSHTVLGCEFVHSSLLCSCKLFLLCVMVTYPRSTLVLCIIFNCSASEMHICALAEALQTDIERH